MAIGEAKAARRRREWKKGGGREVARSEGKECLVHAADVAEGRQNESASARFDVALLSAFCVVPLLRCVSFSSRLSLH